MIQIFGSKINIFSTEREEREREGGREEERKGRREEGRKGRREGGRREERRKREKKREKEKEKKKWIVVRTFSWDSAKRNGHVLPLFETHGKAPHILESRVEIRQNQELLSPLLHWSG